jgi:Protein of unknown function (DUF1580)
MINLKTERLISFTEAAKLFPQGRRGKRPHVNTIYRWTQEGHNGVRLEYAQMPSRRATSVEAVERFIGAMTDQSELVYQSVPTAPQLKRRESEIEAANREADELLA